MSVEPPSLTPRRTCVYVANADSHDITVLALDPSRGALVEVERFDVGGTVMPLAVRPDRRVLYASLRSAPFRVLSLAIDAGSGRLAPIGSAPLPASMCWISTDPSGRFLLSASYGSSVVAVSPIGADGAVEAARQTVATEPNAHSIQVDPSGRFAFAACLGGGVIRQMRFDGASGWLEANEPPVWRARAGAGPRHFVFHPRLALVYLLNELDASVDVLELDRERGTLRSARPLASALPPGFDAGAPWAADLHLTPDGRFLYASERRSSTIAAFAVDGESGALSLLGSTATEAQPRGFAITPDGRVLVAVGEASHRLSVYAIDADTGALARRGGQAVGTRPNWVEVVELPR
jgi:6-phosphogluconolactonase